jgi:cytochrome c peroxidase
MGCALAGIGMGDATAEGEPPPSAAQVAATQRIAAGAAAVHRGQALFADQGCDRCHSIAAIGANGKLGPRLDDAELQALAAFVTAAAGGRDDGGGRGRGRGRSGTD